MTEKLSAAQRRRMAYLADDRDLTGVKRDWFRDIAYVRYNPETGEILNWGRQAVIALRQFEEEDGIPWLPGIGDGMNYYVDVKRQRIRLKKDCPAVVDGLTLRNLPVPCRIEVFSEADPFPQFYDASELELELAPEHPGTYRARIISVPYKVGELEVVAK